MSYAIATKKRARDLRQRGSSIKEIASKLGIAVSTASQWVRGVVVSKQGLVRLTQRNKLGAYRTHLRWEKKRSEIQKQMMKKAHATFAGVRLNQVDYKIMCALLFWAEGSKTNKYVGFINSDPLMIQMFVKLLRKTFVMDEKKFRILLHLHEYHIEQHQMNFWSKITQIPKEQFNSSYIKPHTGNRKRDGYQGSCRVRYYDASVARELTALYNTFAEKILGV